MVKILTVTLATFQSTVAVLKQCCIIAVEHRVEWQLRDYPSSIGVPAFDLRYDTTTIEEMPACFI